MNEIVIFIKENYVSIAVLVSIIFSLLIIISIIGWNLNPPKPELKLVQQVTVETFNNNDITKKLNKLNFSFSEGF